ncbi:MAG: MFS transporter [Candidatus Margulisbacteria bacterium]|nr:MFS transporter [Candidatus Margulisiibacteriota bacterium]
MKKKLIRPLFNMFFRALYYPNYRLYFAGQGISLIGTWMQQVAVSWLAYRLTNSIFMLGLIGFATQAPTLLIVPFSGFLADRLDRRRLLVVTQTGEMLLAFIFAALAFAGVITVWQIILLGVLFGAVNALEMPTRQAFVVDLVEKKEDLANGIALHSTLFNGSRLIGPSIAGLVVAAFGEAICFLINAISFLAAITALLAMKLPRRKTRGEEQEFLAGIKEGFKYTFGFAPIRSIIFLLALVSLLGMPYMVLMPVFARDVLHGGAETLGFLMASIGLGALAGSLYMASRRTVVGLAVNIPLGAAAFGLGLILFSLSNNLYLSMALLFLVGSAMMIQMSSSNTIIQTIVDEDKRGRVMGLFSLAFLGMIPFGSLAAGVIANSFGAPNTLAGSGILCLIGAALFARQLPAIRQKIHPIYVKMGIIPEVASGIQIATGTTVPPEEF